jgi:hypothetical protein
MAVSRDFVHSRTITWFIREGSESRGASCLSRPLVAPLAYVPRPMQCDVGTGQDAFMHKVHNVVTGDGSGVGTQARNRHGWHLLLEFKAAWLVLVACTALSQHENGIRVLYCCLLNDVSLYCCRLRCCL